MLVGFGVSSVRRFRVLGFSCKLRTQIEDAKKTIAVPTSLEVIHVITTIGVRP